jgi:hypothetical protein
MDRVTARLGLAISSDRISAVLVRRGAATWNEVRSLDGAISRADAIAQLVAACPRPHWSRKRVIAAIGPSAVQVKQLHDLPASVNERALGAIVREGAGRFFLKNGKPLETTCAPAGRDNSVWAAAYDASLIAEIEHACHNARWRLGAVVPFVTVLRLVTGEESVAWADGEQRFWARYDDTGLVRLRSGRSDGADVLPVPAPTPAVIGAGFEGADLLPAFAATLAGAQEPLALKRFHSLATAPTRRQLWIAALSSMLALSSWWLAPGVSSTVHAHRAEQNLARLASRLRADRRDLSTLDSVTMELRDLTAFETRARSMTLVLAELTRALPESCTITQLQVIDSTGGSVVAMAPRAAGIVDALERVPILSAPTITGPVAAETLGGRSLERVSVSFALDHR